MANGRLKMEYEIIWKKYYKINGVENKWKMKIKENGNMNVKNENGNMNEEIVKYGIWKYGE